MVWRAFKREEKEIVIAIIVFGALFLFLDCPKSFEIAFIAGLYIKIIKITHQILLFLHYSAFYVPCLPAQAMKASLSGSDLFYHVSNFVVFAVNWSVVFCLFFMGVFAQKAEEQEQEMSLESPPFIVFYVVCGLYAVYCFLFFFS